MREEDDENTLDERDEDAGGFGAFLLLVIFFGPLAFVLWKWALRF